MRFATLPFSLQRVYQCAVFSFIYYAEVLNIPLEILVITVTHRPLGHPRPKQKSLYWEATYTVDIAQTGFYTCSTHTGTVS